MKQIQLTRGQVALVDEEDFERFNALRWCAQWCQYTESFYATHTVRRGGICTMFRMHREIVGALTGEIVDHANHNTLDNRRENLRRCTRLDNNRNVSLRADSSSGYKGVTYYKIRSRWRAYIHAGGKQKSLGYYLTALDAARAYDAAALEYFGEFALTNEALGLLQAEP